MYMRRNGEEYMEGDNLISDDFAKVTLAKKNKEGEKMSAVGIWCSEIEA